MNPTPSANRCAVCGLREPTSPLHPLGYSPVHTVRSWARNSGDPRPGPSHRFVKA